tara:strand:- start:60 stop:1247 length:1188 start_codon:yes stop_codon:yes gene_type:complete
MGGGLMQLVAYGAQDIYLTGNPQITFWKVVYRRCTNFAIESVEQTFMGNAAAGSRATATISRNGDLVSNCVLEIVANQVDTDGSYTDAGMHALVESVEVEIGGQKIDKHYSAWLQIWNELSNPHFGPQTDDSAPAISGYGKAIGALLDFDGDETHYVPLVFWFNRNPGLALPLIALQYHEVKFNFQFAAASEIATDNTKAPAIKSIKMFVDYIYLDTEERRRFAQQSHEYLIDQVQYTGAVSRTAGTGGMQSLRLDFNHPCKELVWVERQTTRNTTKGFPTDFAGIGGTNGSTALLQLNGHDRFAKRPMNYFTRVQPLQHHTNVPYGDRIGVYSFGLRPEDHQPSGTCNFSRIDNATLQLSLAHANGAANEFQVYATNYNVLRIMSGMGGLAYSN